jgi:hypothetical protein
MVLCTGVVCVWLAGCYLGSFVSLPIWGWVCDGDTSNRWHLTFYLSGMLAVAWSLLWLWVGKSSPAEDPLVTPEEKQYVGRASTRCRAVTGARRVTRSAPHTPVHWHLPTPSHVVWRLEPIAHPATPIRLAPPRPICGHPLPYPGHRHILSGFVTRNNSSCNGVALQPLMDLDWCSASTEYVYDMEEISGSSVPLLSPQAGRDGHLTVDEEALDSRGAPGREGDGGSPRVRRGCNVCMCVCACAEWMGPGCIGALESARG